MERVEGVETKALIASMEERTDDRFATWRRPKFNRVLRFSLLACKFRTKDFPSPYFLVLTFSLNIILEAIVCIACTDSSYKSHIHRNLEGNRMRSVASALKHIKLALQSYLILVFLYEIHDSSPGRFPTPPLVRGFGAAFCISRLIFCYPLVSPLFDLTKQPVLASLPSIF